MGMVNCPKCGGFNWENATHCERCQVSLDPESVAILEKKKREEVALKMHDHLNDFIKQDPIKVILRKYINESIGINIKDPKTYSHATILNVTDEYFSIATDIKIVYHIPFRCIIAIAEAVNGIRINDTLYSVCIEVLRVTAFPDLIVGGVTIPLGDLAGVFSETE